MSAAKPLADRARLRMPTVFGPSPGPRADPEGRAWDASQIHRRTTTVSFATDPERLARYLPLRCALAGDAVVTVEHVELENLPWLAGRGYSLLGVKFPIRYDGDVETAHGPFLCVLWENRAEPILTGREELGFAKLYAELPPAERDGASWTARAEWDGHVFIEMTAEDLAPARPVATAGDGVIHHRYFPGVYAERGVDADEMVISPAAQATVDYSRYEVGCGSVRFNRSSWTQLPTMAHIVNALADLPVLGQVQATSFETRGTSDLSDQRRLR